MERKEKGIRKIHLKDYTNALERVLEKKKFSEETKNLLLSMFYKIENAYQDYLNVKVEVYDKGILLENLTNIIDNRCNSIELIDFKIEENEDYLAKETAQALEENAEIISRMYEQRYTNEQRYINEQKYTNQKNIKPWDENDKETIDIYQDKLTIKLQETMQNMEINKKKGYILKRKEGKIISLANEFNLLNAIIELGQDIVFLPDEESLLEKPITYFLNLGMRMHQSEIIRDFNGWSWEIIAKDIENIKVNVIFQTFLYLLGYEFMKEWQQNESNLADYVILLHENLKQNFGEKKAKFLSELFFKTAIEVTSNVDMAQERFWMQRKEKIKLELEKMNDNKAYLEEVTKEKKELTKKIEDIDKIINNKEELEEEYRKRNEKLPNKEKIFSIRHLVTRLETEREEFVKQIKKYNELIEPKGFVARKEELTIKNDFLETLNLEGTGKNNKIANQEEQDLINELITVFLECFEIKIAKAQTKQEIASYFYILRYYGFLIIYENDFKQSDENLNLKEENLKNEQNLKSHEELRPKFEKTINLLIEKAIKLNAVEEITDDTETNNRIIKKLFNSKMIDLKNIIIETKVVDGKLIVEYYDTNILENTYEIECNRTIKLKKKTKLFN